jgi:uncharacterized membrane protein
MDNRLELIAGVGIGAGLMYILDPDRGNRRRALMRDKLVSSINKTGDAIGATSRDVAYRTRGLMAGLTSAFSGGEASDEVVEARVRSKMGRVVSHPSAVEVTADQGRVTLSGPILAREVDDLLGCVSSVKGVTEVENRLEVHQNAGNVPSLQGGSERPGERIDLLQNNWSPATRLLVGATGGALIISCLRRQDQLGVTLGTLGAGLLLQGITNLPMKRLVGVGGGRRAVDIVKTINVAAPVKEVFRFWTNFENFPRFMTNVREVRDSGNGMSHWVVTGPAGVPVEWDAQITKLIPNEVLAWKSVKGSVIANAGIIQFQPNEEGGTRVHIQLSYNPPAGAVGHAVAALFGADPKTEMDEDLMRMKTMIETGIPPRDAAQKEPHAREATARQS